MPKDVKTQKPGEARKASLFSLLAPYTSLITSLVALTLFANALNLLVPRLIARVIDGYTPQEPIRTSVALEFFAVGAGVFLFPYLQNVVQTYASERVARDLRTRLVARLSTQD